MVTNWEILVHLVFGCYYIVSEADVYQLLFGMPSYIRFILYACMSCLTWISNVSHYEFEAYVLDMS